MLRIAPPVGNSDTISNRKTNLQMDSILAADCLLLTTKLGTKTILLKGIKARMKEEKSTLCREKSISTGE